MDERHIDQSMYDSNINVLCGIILIARFIYSAMDDFNNGVVLTSRLLRKDELFEVRLDKMVTKWAGSIEIGVTTHNPTELEYPSTMTNVR